MSALWRRSKPRSGVAPLRPMTASALDAVMEIETAAYEFPWTRGNFIDSLAAEHPAWILEDPPGRVVGYFVAMRGVDEMHLLNITVAPHAQAKGHARRLFDALLGLCQDSRCLELWLEVRPSNVKARSIYDHLGFVQVGLRKGYYPATAGRREDALVMTLKLPAPAARSERDLD